MINKNCLLCGTGFIVGALYVIFAAQDDFKSFEKIVIFLLLAICFILISIAFGPINKIK